MALSFLSKHNCEMWLECKSYQHIDWGDHAANEEKEDLLKKENK